MILHPVPTFPELRTRVAKRIDRWRRGPGKRPITVFVAAIVLSAFAQSIGWMYFWNVFCMSGYDQGCTRKLDWSVWALATFLLYVNAWSIASWISDVSEKRRLRNLTPVVERRLNSLDPTQLARRQELAAELRRRALDREAEQPRAHFQAKLLGWFRNFFVLGSAVPLFTVTEFYQDAASSVAITTIVAIQVFILYKISKHVRRMKRIAKELVAQWEVDLGNLERDVLASSPVGAESLTFRPWSAARTARARA